MKINRKIIVLTITALISWIPTKCIAQSATPQSTPPHATPDTESPHATLSDPEIVDVVITVNQVLIDGAKIALNRSKNRKITDLANELRKDHTALKRQTDELAKRISISPKDNPTSEGLRTYPKIEFPSLKQLSGAAFDKAYLEHEIKFHAAVLKALDESLIPSAKNTELKSFLGKIRSPIEAHLKQSKQLQSAL